MAGDRTVATNRKARFEYHIEEVYEAGIALTGTEIKSIRMGKVSIAEAYATVEGGEVFLHNMHIPPYLQGNRYNHEPTRVRKLLLTRVEIARLAGVSRQRGLTLIPLRLYFKGSWAKVELGVARGKRMRDKRQAIADRDARRAMDRAIKDRLRS